MDKIAFIMAYSDPEKAMEIYVKHFGDTDGLEKTSSIQKEAFLGEVGNWFKDKWKDPQGRKMLMGAGGALAGAGVGYMAGGRRGALMGAGIGGLGGYYGGSPLVNYFSKSSPSNTPSNASGASRFATGVVGMLPGASLAGAITGNKTIRNGVNNAVNGYTDYWGKQLDKAKKYAGGVYNNTMDYIGRH